MHSRSFRRLATAAVLLVLPLAAGAQSLATSADIGQRMDVYANGDEVENLTAGFGLTAMMGGTSSEHFGILFPATAELKYTSDLGMDFNADLDMMLRFWNLSVGVGGNFRFPLKMRSFEYDCRIYEGCPASGYDEAEMDEAVVVGTALSAKYSFGPRGRLFVQGKFIDLSTALDTRGSGTACSDEYGVCWETYAPLYEGGKESRVSAGIAFPDKDGGSKVLRFQWLRQSANYERTQFNSDGGLDRESSVYTIGMSWIP